MGYCFFGFFKPWDYWETRALFELFPVLTRPRCTSFFCSLTKEAHKVSSEGALYLVPALIRASLVEWKVDTKTEYVGGNLARMS